VATKTDHLPPELLPVLDIIAEMVADAMIRDMEKQATAVDDAPRHSGADNKDGAKT